MTDEKPPEEDMISKAEQLAKRIEDANKETKELLAQQEKLRSRQILGGKSQAGTPPPTPDPNASARAMLKGTGYDDLLFPVEK